MYVYVFAMMVMMMMMLMMKKVRLEIITIDIRNVFLVHKRLLQLITFLKQFVSPG